MSAVRQLPLPGSVRYIKNGAGGCWWPTAKRMGQVHGGWSNVPSDLIAACDLAQIEQILRKYYGAKQGATQDFNQLKALLDSPSQHIWVTFQDGDMWWCTVHDGITANPEGSTSERGHFWLNCATGWNNHSLDGKRHLAMSGLPGLVTATAGFKATVCEPRGSREIARIIANQEDEDAIAASAARHAYVAAVSKLVSRLGPKDFELLIDLILSRTGWARIARLGGAVEGIDIEAENIGVGEVAFVQVKSRATQQILNDYVERFTNRRDRYDRMIFAVHKPMGPLRRPPDAPVQVWDGADIANRVVSLGLSDWVATRL